MELSKKGQDLSNSFIPFHTQPNSNILGDDNVSDASFASYDHLIEEVKSLNHLLIVIFLIIGDNGIVLLIILLDIC